MAVYLISEQAIKDTTILNDNVDSKLIGPAILEAQDMHLQSYLGSNLYNKVKSLVSAGTIGSGGNSYYKGLIDNYIQPCLKYYVLADLCIPMTVKMMNKSIATRSADNAQPISLDDIAMLSENLMNKAEWYAQRMINYLMDNPSHFPEYPLSDGTHSNIRAKKSAYTGGMFLGMDYCDKPNYNEKNP